MVEVEPNWRTQLLSAITNPNVALILMLGGLGYLGWQLARARVHASRVLQAIESSVNAILITDLSRPGAPIEYANPAFEKITGYTTAEAVGRDARFLLGQEVTEVNALTHTFVPRRDGAPGPSGPAGPDVLVICLVARHDAFLAEPPPDLVARRVEFGRAVLLSTGSISLFDTRLGPRQVLERAVRTGCAGAQARQGYCKQQRPRLRPRPTFSAGYGLAFQSALSSRAAPRRHPRARLNLPAEPAGALHQ